MDEDVKIIGTPTMALLPARNYSFKIVHKEVEITVPRKGTYKDLDPSFYTEEEGEFMLLDFSSKIMFIPAITKVLFGVNKYPDLESNQLFVPLALVFHEDTVDIIGQVIEMIKPNQKGGNNEVC